MLQRCRCGHRPLPAPQNAIHDCAMSKLHPEVSGASVSWGCLTLAELFRLRAASANMWPCCLQCVVLRLRPMLRFSGEAIVDALSPRRTLALLSKSVAQAVFVQRLQGLGAILGSFPLYVRDCGPESAAPRWNCGDVDVFVRDEEAAQRVALLYESIHLGRARAALGGIATLSAEENVWNASGELASVRQLLEAGEVSHLPRGAAAARLRHLWRTVSFSDMQRNTEWTEFASQLDDLLQNPLPAGFPKARTFPLKTLQVRVCWPTVPIVGPWGADLDEAYQKPLVLNIVIVPLAQEVLMHEAAQEFDLNVTKHHLSCDAALRWTSLDASGRAGQPDGERRLTLTPFTFANTVLAQLRAEDQVESFRQQIRRMFKYFQRGYLLRLQ